MTIKSKREVAGESFIRKIRHQVFAGGNPRRGKIKPGGLASFYWEYDAIALNAANAEAGLPRAHVDALELVANDLKARDVFQTEGARARAAADHAAAARKAEAERLKAEKEAKEQGEIVYIETGKGGRQPHYVTKPIGD